MVVTGSTRGIGLIMARAFAAAGARVVISSRSTAAIEKASREFAESPDTEILGLPCDVIELKQVERLAKRTIDRFGQIDVWVNNAAVNRYFGPTLEVPIDHWNEVIGTNLNGTYHGTIVALRHMLPRNAGKIINLIGAGARDNPGNSYLSAYVTSKAAVRRFTLTAAEDYRTTNLSILGFNPGLFPSTLTTQIQPLNDEASKRMKILDFGLTWLASSPQAIAATAVRIASSASDGQTGKIYRCWPNLVENWQRQRLKIKESNAL